MRARRSQWLWLLLAATCFWPGIATSQNKIRLETQVQSGSFTVAGLGTGAFTSQIKVITDGNPNCATGGGSTVLFCRWNGTSWDTLSEAGGGAPGGTNTQVQFNNAGAFGGLSNGTAGQVLESNGAGVAPSFQDPIVSGPDATGAVSTKNPVQTGGIDYGTGCGVSQPCVRELKVDANGNIYVANFPATQPVSGTVTANAGSGTFTVSGTVTANQGGTWTVQPGNTANTTAWKVDGSAVTQPVSGTVTANAGTGTFTVGQATGTNLHIVCDSGCSSSTAPADESVFTEGTTSFSPVGGYFQTSPTSLTTGHMGAVGMTATRHMFVDVADALPAGTNVIGAVTANIGTTNGLALDASVTGLQVAQASTTSGQKGSLAQGAVTTSAPTYTTAQTDPLSLTTAGALRVDGSGVTQPVSGTVTANAGTGTFNIQADASVNIAQINGSTVSTAATGVQKVGIVGNAGAAVDAATGAAPPANAVLLGALESGATGGLVTGITACDLDKSVNVSTATTTLMVTGVSGRQVRICSINLVAAGADNVALIEGTGATCGTGTAGMAGGTTAATGWNFAANGGLTQGSGLGEIMTTATTGDSVCIATSAAVQLSGHIKYTIY